MVMCLDDPKLALNLHEFFIGGPRCCATREHRQWMSSNGTQEREANAAQTTPTKDRNRDAWSQRAPSLPFGSAPEMPKPSTVTHTNTETDAVPSEGKAQHGDSQQRDRALATKLAVAADRWNREKTGSRNLSKMLGGVFSTHAEDLEYEEPSTDLSAHDLTHHMGIVWPVLGVRLRRSRHPSWTIAITDANGRQELHASCILGRSPMSRHPSPRIAVPLAAAFLPVELFGIKCIAPAGVFCIMCTPPARMPAMTSAPLFFFVFSFLYLNLFFFFPTAAGVSHDSPRTQTCTLRVPPFKHQNSTRRPPREGRNKEKCGGRGKECEIMGSPPLGAPRCGAHAGPTLRAPTLGAPTFSRSGPPPLWAPTPPGSTLRGFRIRAPTLQAEALRAFTFSGFGPPTFLILSYFSLFLFCAFSIVSISCHFFEFVTVFGIFAHFSKSLLFFEKIFDMFYQFLFFQVGRDGANPNPKLVSCLGGELLLPLSQTSN